MVDTIEDIEPPYRSGDSDKVARQTNFLREQQLEIDVAEMIYNAHNSPFDLINHAKIIINRVRMEK
jgi:hypothetical protein